MAKKIQPSFAKGEVGPSLYARVDTAAYQVGLRTALNGTILATGGFENRPGLRYIGPVKDHDYAPRLIPFEFKTTDTHILEFGDQYMRVIRDDDYVKEAAKTIVSITKANPGVVEITGHGYTAGQDVYLSVPTGMTELNGRWFRVGTTTTDTFQLLDQVDGSNINTTSFGTYSSGGTAQRIYEIATPYLQADLMELGFVQSADVLTIVHPDYQAREVTRSALASWAITAITFAPSIAAPAGAVTITPVTSGSTTYNYVVTAEADNGEESLASAVGTTTTGNATPNNTVSWSAVSGAVVYNVYRQRGGTYGFIGRATGTTFTDNNFSPDVNDSPYESRDPISASNKRPGAVGYYEQRRVFGGSNDNPDTSYFTVVGSAKNMSVAQPGKDDDAITAALPATKVNAIRHYVPLSDLLVFTSGSEWRVNSGQDSAFAASTIKQKPQTYWGCSFIKPVVVGSTVIFVEENNARVRTLGFNLQIDGYTGTDLNLLADHIFRDHVIVDGAMAKLPHNVCLYVRDDGTVASCTFQQEQEVIAWGRLRTRGWFERVATVRRASGGIDDRAYFVVQRYINGRYVRFVERMVQRRFTDVRDCFFVDSGLSLDAPIDIAAITLADPIVIETETAHGLTTGDEVDLFDIEWAPTYDDDYGSETQPDQLNRRRYTITVLTSTTFELDGVDGTEFSRYVEGGTVRKAVSTLTGLDHLEGEEVVCLADGNVVRGLTVEDGSISFPRKYSRVHVGLPYTSEMETLNIEVANSPTLQGRQKKVSTVTLRFERSRGALVGHGEDADTDMVEMAQREDEAYGDPTALLTGDKKITLGPSTNDNGRVKVRQKDPLPFTVLAVISDLELEDITNAE
jgi:hypothetical protein